MGVSRKDRKALERVVWFTGHARRGMVKALARIDGAEGRDAYVEAALGVSSANRAHHFERLAQLMELYHDEKAPIERIQLVAEGNAAVAAADGQLVVFIFGDHVVWCRETAAVLAAPAEAVPEWPAFAGAEVVVSGTLSERAQAELKERGFGVYDRAFERLPLPKPHRKWYRRWWDKLDSL